MKRTLFYIAAATLIALALLKDTATGTNIFQEAIDDYRQEMGYDWSW